MITSINNSSDGKNNVNASIYNYPTNNIYTSRTIMEQVETLMPSIKEIKNKIFKHKSHK